MRNLRSIWEAVKPILQGVSEVIESGVRASFVPGPRYSGGPVHRLGMAVWWLCSGIALGMFLIGVVLAAFAVRSDWVLCVPCFCISAVAWVVGRMFRFVLAAD